MASPPSSVPASPIFEWAHVGSDWEAEGATVIASGMLAEERYAVGSKIVQPAAKGGPSKATFTYTINKVFYPDAHMFLGVAEVTDDPEKAETYAFSPTTGNLYNGHQLNEHGDEKQRVHLMADPKGDLTGKQEGSIITCFIDYDDGPAGSLKFSANGEDPIDSQIKLPEDGVRPWVFLYHEGDSVTVEEVC